MFICDEVLYLASLHWGALWVLRRKAFINILAYANLEIGSEIKISTLDKSFEK